MPCHARGQSLKFEFYRSWGFAVVSNEVAELCARREFAAKREFIS